MFYENKAKNILRLWSSDSVSGVIGALRRHEELRDDVSTKKKKKKKKVILETYEGDADLRQHCIRRIFVTLNHNNSGAAASLTGLCIFCARGDPRSRVLVHSALCGKVFFFLFISILSHVGMVQ